MELKVQDIFNRAWMAFVIEGRPFSVSEDNNCEYRSREGHACAIGLCIPDEMYDPDMEENDVFGLERKFDITFDDIKIAKQIQLDLHDNLISCRATPERIEEIYRTFAAKHNLTIPNT